MRGTPAALSRRTTAALASLKNDAKAQDPAALKEAAKQFESFFSERESKLAVHIPDDKFFISSKAIKKKAKTYKSILKLDKNFHVYIHGDRNLIEKGYDKEKGKSYYKIYFDTEQ